MIHRYRWDAPRDHGVPFRVYSHGLNEAMPPGLVECRSEDDWLLVLFRDPVQVDLGRGAEPLAENTLVAWAPGMDYRYGHPERAWLHSWIHVAGTAVAGILAEAGMAPLTPRRIGRPLLAEHYLEQIFGEISSHAQPDNRILRNLFENWLLDMARESGSASPRPPPAGLQRLKRHLDRAPAQRMPLAAMARIAGLSPSHLSAEFQRCFGISPGAYLIRRRMDEARYLLRHRNLAIAEVAGQVGYPDIFQFSRMFRRVVGTSPGAYRRGGAGDVAGA